MDYVTWGKTDFKMACRDTDCYPVFLMNFIIDVHKFNIVFGVVSNIWFGVDGDVQQQMVSSALNGDIMFWKDIFWTTVE